MRRRRNRRRNLNESITVDEFLESEAYNVLLDMGFEKRLEDRQGLTFLKPSTVGDNIQLILFFDIGEAEIGFSADDGSRASLDFETGDEIIRFIEMWADVQFSQIELRLDMLRDLL